MSKQDRQGVRTPADIEMKYDLGGVNNLKADNSKINILLSQMSQSLSEIKMLVNEVAFYCVSFLDGDSLIASYVLKKGDAINPPIDNSSWVDSDGNEVTFPFLPKTDTNLYISK